MTPWQAMASSSSLVQGFATRVRLQARALTRVAALALTGLLLGLGATGVAHAEDPPLRVGRIAEVLGAVWIFDAESNEWVQAVRNHPVTTADRLSTERGGRAEVRIGATVVYLGGRSEIEFSRLDDDAVQVQLNKGAAAAWLRSREAAREFSLVTANGRFLAEAPGHYRFDHNDEDSAGSVIAGQLQFQARDAGVSINPGQRAEFWQQAGTQYRMGDLDPDRFSAWVAERETRSPLTPASRYVSPEMIGAEDLDQNGRWQTDAEYGALWVPHVVPVGWAPYRMGHWAWVRPWGWTWVDDAPWGFAPFHYGRWVWRSNEWCWAPGRYESRPVYAPALVGWVGAPGVQVSVRVGNAPSVGWFPLAPREVYVPGFRFTPSYLRIVNASHVPRITQINTILRNPDGAPQHLYYRNRELPHAMTVVPASVMSLRQPVAPAIVQMTTRLHGESRGEPVRRDPPMPSPSFERRPSGSGGFVVPPAPGSQRDERAGRGRREDDRRDEGRRDDRSGDRFGDRGERRGVQAVMPAAQPAQPMQPVRPVQPDDRRIRSFPPGRDADRDQDRDRWPRQQQPVPTPAERVHIMPAQQAPAAAPAFVPAPAPNPLPNAPREFNERRFRTPRREEPPQRIEQPVPQPGFRSDNAPPSGPGVRGGQGPDGGAGRGGFASPVRQAPPVASPPPAVNAPPPPAQQPREQRREQHREGRPDRGDEQPRYVGK